MHRDSLTVDARFWIMPNSYAMRIYVIPLTLDIHEDELASFVLTRSFHHFNISFQEKKREPPAMGDDWWFS
jgi:hypothetical protein